MNPKSIFCTWVLALGIIFKFWLIAKMEITDDISDSFHYVSQILFNSGLFYAPGTSYFGKLLAQFGIPFRLGIEIAYLLSSLLALRALLDWPTRSYLSLTLYLFVIFNPAPEELFSHIMSDQVWMVGMVAGLSLFIFFAGDRPRHRRTYAILSGLCLGFATITRITFIPLMVIIFLWIILSGILFWSKNKGKGLGFPVLGGCFLCLYFLGFTYYAICWHNSQYNGFFGISAFDSVEFRTFYMRLQSVGDSSGEKYFPVDETRQKLIAQAGPESRHFIDELSRDHQFREISRDVYGKYDLASNWFCCAVFETACLDGDLNHTFASFKKIEKEIADSAQNKTIPVRAIPPVPLPDCRVGIVLSALPAALRHVARETIHEPARYAWDWGNGEPRFDDADFSKALTRRTVTASPEREKIGRVLCTIYSPIYSCLFIALGIVLGLFVGSFAYHWKKIPGLTFHFLAQQLFLLSFLGFFGWYVLFDASGLYVVSRYMIFNNVILPFLVVYYARKTLQLLRADYSSF